MSISNTFIYLKPSDLVPDRPFTNPEKNAEDLTALEYIAQRLRYVLSQAAAIPDHPRPYVFYLPEAGGRRLRIVITNLLELMAGRDMTVVGFCGQKRPGASRSSIEVVDIELVSEFLHHPHLLSYNSLELEGGNWRNLVLFSHPQGIMHWTASEKHAYAAMQLAPQYYLAIRLHNGFLPGGLLSGHQIILTRTKYYDYHTELAWRAVRELRNVTT